MDYCIWAEGGDSAAAEAGCDACSCGAETCDSVYTAEVDVVVSEASVAGFETSLDCGYWDWTAVE